ncbi:MAG: transposase, partial [Chloroflexota bacterium]|nr:transposase [Chloroflexota bacterium]
MSAIPQPVMAMVDRYFEPLLVWFSEKVYAELIARAGNHLLVNLHDKLDFGFLEETCAPFHHTSGPGTRPTHTVPRMVRALLVKYLFDWSLRQLEFQIRYNLIVKWFVGYGVLDAGPDHSTLQRFEDWVREHQHRVFFDEVLHQIDEEFPEERQQPQIGDTYAMHADAAKEALVRLIRHTCERILGELASMSPAAHQCVVGKLDRVTLFGPEDEPSYFRMSSDERKKQLRNTVVGALQLIQLVREQLAAHASLTEDECQVIVNWLGCLEKILGDEVEIQRNAEGQVERVTRLPKNERGSYRIGSATDPDATYRVHGENKVDFGYNVNVAATVNFVREIRADTGAQPDAVAIPDLLEAQIEHHDTVPDKFIYDAAAGNGKTHAAVEEATDGQTQLVAPLISNGKDAERFTPADFTLSDDGDTLTCPNGQTTDTAYSAGNSEGRNFHFPASQCEGCPLWEDCRGTEAEPGKPRRVFVSDYHSQRDAARAYSETDEFKADMKLRPNIERIIAGITRHNGGRRARCRGRYKSDFQAKMNATAYNIKRWFRLS